MVTSGVNFDILAEYNHAAAECGPGTCAACCRNSPGPLALRAMRHPP